MATQQNPSYQPQNSYNFPVPGQGPIVPPSRFGFLRTKYALTAIIGVTVLVGGVLWWQYSRAVDPEKLFANMLEHSLSLSSHQVALEKSNPNLENEYVRIVGEVSSQDNGLATLATLTAKLQGTDITMETARSAEGTFAKVSNYPQPLAPASLNPATFNNWVKLEEDGQSAPVELGSLSSFVAGIHTKTGIIPLGKFSNSDRRDILRLINEQGVYQRLGQPVRYQFEGMDIFEYDIEIPMDKLNALNEEVARRAGEDYSKIKELYNIREKTRLRLKIDTKTKALVWLQILDPDESTTTMRFSRQNQAADFTSPQAQTTATDINDLLSKLIR